MKQKIRASVWMRLKSIMLDPAFADGEEKLFRAILPLEAFWDEENNRPTSGAFKDNKGLSVDRQAGRSVSDAVQALLATKKEDSKIVSVTVSFCRSVPVLPVYKPVENNIYHSEIHDSEEKIGLSSGKAKALALSAQLEN